LPAKSSGTSLRISSRMSWRSFDSVILMLILATLLIYGALQEIHSKQLKNSIKSITQS